ncbi:MAG: ABC transporter permease [bacterium]
MSPRAIVLGLRRLFKKAHVERELDDEVRHYLALSVDEKMRTGLSRESAERASWIEFGGVEATKDQVRSGGWEAALETMAHDARFAVRGLRRNPGFSVIAVLTLALGIGANTAMFSVVNAVMLRPLPYRDASRLALIWTDDVRRGLHQEGTAFRTIGDWQRDSRSLLDVAFYNTERRTLAGTGTGAGPRERTRAGLVSANLLPLLGVAPIRGRAISTSEEANRAPVAVISYAFWQRRFGGASDIIGKTMTIEDARDGGSSLTIIGVMPATFYFPDKQTEFWTPATTYWRFTRESSERFPAWARRWTAIARLKPNASMNDARADLARIGSQLSATYKSDVQDFPGFSANVEPMLDFIAGRNLQSALWVLLGAVGFVLLVACANVANLLLARGATRQQEFAVRRALGAGRGRLIRQLAVEGIVLALCGGALGLLIAAWGTRVLAAIAASQIPRIDEIAVDARVLAFAGVLSLVAGVIFGLAPAFRISATDASESLKEAGSVVGARFRRGRGFLVIVECSLAIVLLAGAGLLIRSLGRVQSVDAGFDPHSVLTVRVEFPPETPPTPEENTQTSRTAPTRARARVQRMDDLMARVQSVPGVGAVGFTDDMFISRQGNGSITIPGRAGSLAAGELNEASVTPGFFSAMHVPLRLGRSLTRDDVQQKIRALWTGVRTQQSLDEKEQHAIPEPVVVNDAFVRRFFPDEDPIGKRFCIDPTNKTYWYVVVGVVGDMHRQGLERTAIPEYYGPYIPSPLARADFLVRTHGDPLAIAPTIRQLIAAAFPNALVVNVSTADRQLADFAAERRFQTWLLAAFAALALVLAAVGIYGVVHYGVAERRREIGVRIALGASPMDVVRLVVGHGMRTPSIGILIGLALSFGLTRVMSHLLFAVSATDPATFVAVGVVLAGVAGAACWIPARRAARVDPMTALRRE